LYIPWGPTRNSGGPRAPKYYFLLRNIFYLKILFIEKPTKTYENLRLEAKRRPRAVKHLQSLQNDPK